MLVIFGACAGLLYSALWFFPVLIIAGGIVTAIWDVKLRQLIMKAKRRWQQKRRARRTESPEVRPGEEAAEQGEVIELPAVAAQDENVDRTGLQRRAAPATTTATPMSTAESSNAVQARDSSKEDEAEGTNSRTPPSTDVHSHGISIRVGCIIIAGFFGEHFPPPTNRRSSS